MYYFRRLKESSFESISHHDLSDDLLIFESEILIVSLSHFVFIDIIL